jgi:hypothetical protein
MQREEKSQQDIEKYLLKAKNVFFILAFLLLPERMSSEK